MKTSIAILLVALPLPALAGPCDRWKAGMQEDEGGPVMTAQVCAPSGESSHDLLVTCGNPGKLSIRFLAAATPGFEPADPEFKTDLQLSVGPETVTQHARYEAMDGAMVFETDIRAPFVNALQTGESVTLSDAGGKVPGATFTLKGSRAALEKLTATCPEQ